MAAKGPHVASGKTLFVRNLPFTATDDSLETVFSDFGPIKKAFVVKDRGNDKCRGFGYVTFSMFEDAVKAQRKLKKIEGRNVHILFADKKKPKKKPKKESKDSSDSDDEDESELVKSESDNQNKPVVKRHISQHEQYKTVVVSWKPSKKDVLSYLKEPNIKNVATVEMTKDPLGEACVAHVCFKSVRDAMRGCRKLSKNEVKGIMLDANLMSQVSTKKKAKKAQEKPGGTSQKGEKKNLKEGRLIIRNLSFKCEPKDLEEPFAKFGAVSEVSLPKKADGKPCGFGFVQFADVAAAEKAIKKMNGKLVLNRPIAVDWSIKKNKYVAAKIASNQAEGNTKKKKTSQIKRSDMGSDSDTDSELDDKSESESEEEDENYSDSDESLVSKDDIEQDESNDSVDESDEVAISDDENDDDEEDEDDDDDNDDDDSGSENNDNDHKQKSRKKDKKPKARKSDVDEGRTLFIRNLPFSAEEEDLEGLLSQYGELSYCRLVIDPSTDHPKGSAFVQFKNKEAAAECLEKNCVDDKSAGLMMEGRKLLINMAVNPKQLKEMNDKEKKLKENKDKRNLFLAREGLIRPGTEEAKELSKADLDKRMKVEAVKRQKLKNQNIFISTTRLCIRNLPTNVDDKGLRTLLLKNLDDRTAKITECRVMRDLNRVNAANVGKSRGYAFVTFNEHKHALRALRETNNNPEIFGKDKRPIVEFSLENKVALLAKEKRLERHLARKAKVMMEQTSTKSWKHKKQLVSDLSKLSEQERLEKAKGKYGPKGLPTHWGAKVRHKPRTLQAPQKRKKKKKNQTTKEVTKQPGSKDLKKQKPEKRKKGKPKMMSDNFDKLVHSYKQKILSASGEPPIKKARWFNS